jgi:CBS domain-containing protein
MSKLTEIASRPVKELLSDPIIVNGDDPISEVIGRLVSNRANEVFVREEVKTGIVTLRSILRGGEVADRKASTLAQTPPVLLSTDPISKAAKIMSNMRIRSLPVFDTTGKLEGSVTSNALLEKVVESDGPSKSISDIMTARPVTVDFSDSVDKARSIMVEKDFDHLPVTKNGQLSGLVTSLDLLSTVGPNKKLGRVSKQPEPSSRGSAQVGGLLKNTPLESDPLADSLRVLKDILKQEKTCSVVVSKGKLEGIVTLRDFVRLLAIEPDPKGPPVYMVGLPDQDFESSQAETKFRRSIEALAHVYPGIVEARAIVKTKTPDKNRRRWELNVMIRSASRNFEFTEDGWSIAEVFEKVGEKTKRLMTKPKDSPAHHRRPSREEIEAARYSE